MPEFPDIICGLESMALEDHSVPHRWTTPTGGNRYQMDDDIKPGEQRAALPIQVRKSQNGHS